MVVTKMVLPSNGSDSLSRRLARRVRVGDLRVHLAFYLETEVKPTLQERELLECVFERPGYGRLSFDFNRLWAPGAFIEIGYQAGIVDNESDSIHRACELVGVDSVAARASRMYESREPGFVERLRGEILNTNIESFYSEPPRYDTLRPKGEYLPPARWDLRDLDEVALGALGCSDGRNLSVEQMKQIVAIQRDLGAKEITDVLLESLDARWSDHCHHTTWKSLGDLLGQLQDAAGSTENPNIVSMFSDNAGVWDFYDGWSLVIKAETHNGPTAVSSYFGQLTKLGGVLRDILGTGLGADPIGVFEYTATGLPTQEAPISGRPRPTQVVAETVDAIGEYGNTFGTPMAWSRMEFHPGYAAKPFALGGALGLIQTRHAHKGSPKAGDTVVLVGGLTGNDGIHGASASSAGGVMASASVQIGSPLEEVKFRQALLDLRDAGCIRAITDVGGAGLNSAVGEMGDPCGVWINTALVPLKTSGLPIWRVLLSESQERMVVAVPLEKIATMRAVMASHEVRATVIGRFDGSGRFTVLHDQALSEEDALDASSDVAARASATLGFAVPYEYLEYRPPQQVVERYHALQHRACAERPLDIAGLAAVLPELMGNLRVASQESFARRYDSTVQGCVRHSQAMSGGRLPCAYWASQPLENSPAAALLTMSFDPYLFEAGPIDACGQMLARVVSHLMWAGVALEDIALCDNFYTPHKTRNWESVLSAMVQTLATFSRNLGVPFISGKDSSAGSVETPAGWVHVPPGVFLTGVGKAPDYRRLRPNAWRTEDAALVLLGLRTPSLNATVFSQALGGPSGVGIDKVDCSALMELAAAISAVDQAMVRSYLPLGPGGSICALAQASIAMDRAVHLCPDLPLLDYVREHRIAVIGEVGESSLARLPSALEPLVLGRLGPGAARLDLDGEDLLTPWVRAAWGGALREALDR